VALSAFDRDLLTSCLARETGAWERFVDRFLGLVLHVIDHTARCRGQRLNPQDREDLSADVFLALLDDDFQILRRFRGQSSLATYITVVARRVVVRNLNRRLRHVTTTPALDPVDRGSDVEQRISDREEVERLLTGLDAPEADVVRLYHLEGKSYHEISSQVGMPENSIGPTLSRARSKMRARADTTHLLR
jgi:RNA polymerase sigma-70 factor (ECF subfamily)